MTIPKKQHELIRLASSALTGAIKHAESVDLQHNKPAKIASSIYTLTGEPGEGPNAGKQGQLNATRTALSRAQANRRKVVAEGRAYCRIVVDRLKPHLGNNWNPEWISAGFGNGTLALPANPLALLLELRGYFRRNPQHEGQNPEVSANRTEAMASAIQVADQEVANAKSARASARKERDAAKAELASRMSALQAELDQLLDEDDERWFEFGLNRPVDGRIPSRVEGLSLQAITPGEVIVQWERSAQAKQYRVSYQVQQPDAKVIEAGLFADPMAILRGLPSGAKLTVKVSARNSSGETVPTEAAITVG